LSGFGGLEVAWWILVPKFAGSNPTEAVGFFRAEYKGICFLTGKHRAIVELRILLKHIWVVADKAHS
jgi:hypothetical protein